MTANLWGNKIKKGNPRRQAQCVPFQMEHMVLVHRSCIRENGSWLQYNNWWWKMQKAEKMEDVAPTIPEDGDLILDVDTVELPSS